MIPKIALLTWPLAAALFFRFMSLPGAVAATIIAGYLLLPTRFGFNFPMIPTFNKDLIPALSALCFAAMWAAKTAPDGPKPLGYIPRSQFFRIFIAGLVIGGLATTLTNDGRLVYGARVLRGLTLYDGLSNIMDDIVSMLPLLLAWKYLAHPDAQRSLLLVLGVAGALYALPSLYEVRMSPQINSIVYGFFPHQWAQHIRNDGFRPVVFLEHGLWLGIFLSMATIAAAACLRIKELKPLRIWLLIAVVGLFGTLVLSKNFGALGMAILLVPTALFLGTRLQLIVAATIAALVLSYPALRGVGLIPVDQAVSFVEKIDPARSKSLNYRMTNEEILLEKANQRALFGWGTWGRNRAFNEQGRDVAATDGGWVLVIGQGGWVRYISQMGLIALPIIILCLRRNRYALSPATAGLCLLLTANLLDLIPNDTLTPITWLVAGALLGRLELGRIEEGQEGPQQQAPQPPSRYSRTGSLGPSDTATGEPRYTRQTQKHPVSYNTTGQS